MEFLQPFPLAFDLLKFGPQLVQEQRRVSMGNADPFLTAGRLLPGAIVA